MSAQFPHAVTSGDCALCDGACRHPQALNPIERNYPFMSSAHIEATHPATPEPAPATGRRARRLNRMARSENRPAVREDRHQ